MKSEDMIINLRNEKSALESVLRELKTSKEGKDSFMMGYYLAAQLFPTPLEKKYFTEENSSMRDYLITSITHRIEGIDNKLDRISEMVRRICKDGKEIEKVENANNTSDSSNLSVQYINAETRKEDENRERTIITIPAATGDTIIPAEPRSRSHRKVRRDKNGDCR